MKKIIYKGTIEESDYNRVKDIDSENYITPDGTRGESLFHKKYKIND